MGQPPWLRDPLRLAGAGLLCTTLLSGCSGTRFGDQLARSFSSPPAASADPPKASTTPAAKPVKPAALAAAPVLPPPVAAAAPAAASAAAGPPAPYRVTLRLPAADSSAPAERVTQALRAAGVSFEVETIERMEAGAEPAAAATPRRSPAPPPR